jgi:hypothetical protein
MEIQLYMALDKEKPCIGSLRGLNLAQATPTTVQLTAVSEWLRKLRNDLVYKPALGNLCMWTLYQSYVARPQSKFPIRPTASKPYIARSDCAYVKGQCCSMAHALTVLPAFSQ